MLAWGPGLVVLVIVVLVFGVGEHTRTAAEAGRILFFILMGTFTVGLVAYLVDAWRRHRQRQRHLPIH